MNVLLVEDDPSIREGMTELVGELADVHAASSVAQALEAFSKQVFDLVITDLHIRGDGSGGRTVVGEARRQLAPVVIVSAMAREEILHELSATPPDEILLKPFALEDVLSLTERFLAARREADRVARLGDPRLDLDFKVLQPGYSIAKAQHASDRDVVWFRLSPGASIQHRPDQQELSLIVQGSVAIGEGVHRKVGDALYATAGAAVALRSEEGALGVTLISAR